MKTAAVYLRSSKDRADMSPAAQRRALTELAERRGETVVADFSDAAESGKDENRPGFQRLLEAVRNRNRGWSTLLVLDTARIARRRLLAIMFEEECRKHGITVVYRNLPDTDPVTMTVIKGVFQAFDEWHSLTSKMKGLAGMSENVLAGWRAGGRAPMGYRLEHVPTGAVRDGAPVTKSRLVPGDRAEAVQKYLKARAARTPRAAAAREAGLADVPATTLLGMERNALTYAGHTVWGVHAERMGGAYVGGSKYRPRSEWTIRRDTHEALITEAEAEAILESLERGGRKGRRTRGETLLGGLLVDRQGRPWHSSGDGYRIRQDGRWVSISKGGIEPVLLDRLEHDLTSPEVLRTVATQVRRGLQELLGPDEGGDVQAELADLDRQMNRMLELAGQSETPAPMLRRVEELERQRESLVKAAEEEARRAEAARELANVTEDQVAAVLRRVLEEAKEAPAEGLKGTLCRLIEKVELDPATLEGAIHYRLDGVTGVKLASPRGRELIPGFPAIALPFRLRRRAPGRPMPRHWRVSG